MCYLLGTRYICVQVSMIKHINSNMLPHKALSSLSNSTMAYPSILKVTIIHKGGRVEFSESTRKVLMDEIVQRSLRSSRKNYRVYWMDSAGVKTSLRNFLDLHSYILAAGRHNQQAHIYVKQESKLRKVVKSLTRKMQLKSS